MLAAMDSAHRSSPRWAWPAVLVLWCATVAGFAGILWWPLDLLSNFRPHYAIAFLVPALALLLARRWLGVGLALAGLIVNALVVTSPFATAHARGDTATGADGLVRLVTLNVWVRNRDFERVADYLASTAADVVVLQEVSAADALTIAAKLPALPYAFVDAARLRHGTAILSRHRILDSDAVQLVPDGVTVARVRMEVDGETVNVIGAHLHWPVGPHDSALRNAELHALAELAADRAGPVLVAGDLNITLWSPWFGRFVEESGLSECSGGAALPGSWPAWLGPAAIRIDHCLMSSHFTHIAIQHGDRVGSDHRPVVNDLALTRRFARQ